MASSPSVRHDRESVTRAALEVLDEVGLADLTMRRLADRLGIGASALYWHVANKQELLAAVADDIVTEAIESLDTTPAADPVELVSRVREAILTHRDAAEIVVSTRALSLGDDPVAAAITTALHNAGAPDAAPLAATIVDYLLGHTSLLQQRLQAHALGLVTEDLAQIRIRADTSFATGLRILLRGGGVSDAARLR